MPTTGLPSLGWTQASEGDSGGQRLHAASVVCAALLITASTLSNTFELSALGSDPARAGRGSESGPAVLPGSETAVGAFSGVPYTYPSQVRIGGNGQDELTVDPVHWYTNPFKSPIYYGARVVRWFGGGRSGMLVDFIHSKAIAEPDKEASFSGTVDGKPVAPRARIGDVFQKLEFSHGHNMLLFNGVFRLPSIGPRVAPYAGAGAGVLLPHTEVELAGENAKRTYEYNYAGPAAQALLGVEIRLARLSFFVEYKATWGHYSAPLSEMDGSWLPLDLWRQATRWFAGEAPPGGHVSTDVVSHQVVSGISVRVVSAP